MFEKKNKKIELISVFPYKENNTWFFRLIYEIEDTETGEIRDIIIPKCVNPFSEKCFDLDYIEDRWPFDPEIFGLEDPRPKPATSCHLINEYCKLPILLAYDDSIKGPAPYYFGETIIKPATKEMTLEEIDDDGSVTYSDNDRAYGLVDGSDLAFVGGRVTEAVNSLFPIEMPYYPATNKYKVLFHSDDDDYPYAIITPDGDKVKVRYSEDKGYEKVEEVR